jgi:probable F420-dependent oxidoreductase
MQKETLMKLGVVFPQNEIGADPRVVREFAQAVERMGYDYLLAYDHVLGANPERPGGWNGPYTYEHLFHEVFTLFSHLAALTTTLEFATGILVLPQRETALVAKQATEVYILSEGRLRLGVGIGWNEVELQSLGFDFSKRGRRIEEQVQLLRRLWTEPLIKFDSEFHHFDDVGILPRPEKSIPIWFGGSADAVLKRMAQYGDGWMPNSANPEKLKTALVKIHEHMQAVGRNPAEFGWMCVSMPPPIIPTNGSISLLNLKPLA